MRQRHRGSVGRVVRRVSLPPALPAAAEQTAAELARVTFERTRLLRELAMLDQKRDATAQMLAKVNSRVDQMLDHLDQLLTPPAAGEAAAQAPAQAPSTGPSTAPSTGPRKPGTRADRR